MMIPLVRGNDRTSQGHRILRPARKGEKVTGWLLDDGEVKDPLQCPRCQTALERQETMMKSKKRRGSGTSWFCSHCQFFLDVRWVRQEWDPEKRRFIWRLQVKIVSTNGFVFPKPAPYCLLPWSQEKESQLIPDAETLEMIRILKEERDG